MTLSILPKINKASFPPLLFTIDSHDLEFTIPHTSLDLYTLTLPLYQTFSGSLLLPSFCIP